MVINDTIKTDTRLKMFSDVPYFFFKRFNKILCAFTVVVYTRDQDEKGKKRKSASSKPMTRSAGCFQSETT